MGATAAIAMATQSISGAYTQSEAMRAQGAYQRQQSEMNAQLAEYQAEDAVKRGEKDARDYGRKVRGVVGAQRAGYAGQGVDINSGTAAAVQEETKMIGEIDQMTIKSNAWKEAWGFKASALNSRSQGVMAANAASFNANTTLLTGGLNAAAYGARAWGIKKGTIKE